MNRFAYYALKCEQGGYAYTKALDGVSFCGGSVLTFSCDFYYDKGYSGPLFSQKESVLGEVKNGYISWSLNNGTVLKSDSSAIPLWEEGWNHLDVVYTKDKLTMYINRASASEKSIGEARPASGENLVIGEDYPGYIRNVRIADFAFTQEDVLRNCVQTQIEQDKLLLYIPFDEFDVKDKGKNALPVVCYGLGRMVTLAGALSFSGSGFAAIHGRELNPGTATMPEFTIALRTFLNPSQQENCVLYENASEQGDGFALKLNQTSDGAFLALEAGAFSYGGPDIPLSCFQWQDVCVAVKDKQASIYVNGELKKNLDMPQAYTRISSAQIYLGDHRKDGKSVNGAIDYFAVYGRCLSPEQISEISKVEPYLFDDAIAGLYLFHGEGLQDMVGSGSLSLSGCELKLLEGTVFEPQIEPFTFRASDTFPGSDFELWEADTLIDVYLPVVAGLSGITLPEKIPGSIKWRLLQEASSIQAVQSVFEDYNNLEEVPLEDMVEALGISAAVTTLAVSASLAGTGTSCFSGFSMFRAMKEEEDEEAWALLLLPFIAYFIKEIVDDRKKKKPKDPPDPPPVPVPLYGYLVTLETVQFCLDDGGSLPLRVNFTTPQSLPEWTAKTSGTAKIAYMAKQQKPAIKIGFYYKPALNQMSAQVTLYGSGKDFFGSFQSEPVHCIQEGSYSTTAYLNDFKIGKDASPGCYEDQINWSYNNYMNVRTFLRTSQQQIHVIPSEPLYPWSLTDPGHYPTVELLELTGKMIGDKREEVTDESSFIKKVYEYLRDTVKPKYTPQPKYTALTKWSVTDVDMDNQKLFGAIGKPGAELGALDVCAMTQYLAAMEGWQPRIIGFFGVEYVSQTSEGDKISSLGLKMKDMEAWGAEVTTDTQRHYAMASSKGEGLENMVISDITWNPKGTGQYLGDLPLADYMDKTVENTDYFGPNFIGYRVNEQSEAIVKHAVGVIDLQTVFGVSPRPGFATHIKNKYKLAEGQACCHRVSYKYMERLLVNMFNKLTSGKIDIDNRDTALEYMWNAFYVNDRYSDLYDKANKEYLKAQLLLLQKITSDELQSANDRGRACNIMNSALYYFNSADLNLRPGNASWNSSVGPDFDPEKYEIVFMIGNILAVVNQNGELGYEMRQRAPGIYLMSPEDQCIFTWMSNAATVANEGPPRIGYAFRRVQITDLGVCYIPFLYSSNNNFPIPAGVLHKDVHFQVLDPLVV